MNKLIISALIVLSAPSAFAKNLDLVCMLGDIADLDIRVYTVGAKATIEVKETEMSGEEKILINTHTSNREVQDAITAGKIFAVVSKSDLQDMFGGAYLDAGMLDMTLDQSTQKWDVLWSFGSVVMTAVCSEKTNK